MTHRCYFELQANSHADLGVRKGKLLGNWLRDALGGRKAPVSRGALRGNAKKALELTAKHFPHLVEELQGYAKGAGVPFNDLWMLTIQDEFTETEHDKCTTVVTNNGFLVAHNEDWSKGANNAVCILRQTIGGVIRLEVFYLNTLGGNSISMNSHGFVHAVNSLTHTDGQVGVPRNIIARWLSETKSPEDDFKKLSHIPRASGYHHTLVRSDGTVWSIECTAKKQVMTTQKPPCVHTNHYVTQLRKLEADNEDEGTRARYKRAAELMRPHMSIESAMQLLDDTSAGVKKSIFNERTIARVVLDNDHMIAHIWMLREKERGWLEYHLYDR